MAIDAGTLEIKLLMGLARLQQDVTQAKDIVGRGMAGIQSAVASAKSALAGLGITLGVGAFTALVKGSIDAMDHLNDLSKSTGLAVEQLSGLRIAAKQSGSDLDGVAASINKLSVNMGQNGEKFKALGVTAKDPLEAFKQLADVFSTIQDPQLRAALGAEALGKSWATAAPLLAEGGAKIGEMVDRGARLSGVTKEMAEQADAFNDKLVLLTGTQGTWNRLIGPVLPLLNVLADQMLKSREEAAKLGESDFKPLLEAAKAVVVVAGTIGHLFQEAGREIGAMAARLAAVASGDFRRANEITIMAAQDAETARTAFVKWERSILAVGSASKSAADDVKGLTEEQLEAARISEAQARAFLEAEKRKKEAADAGKLAAKLEAEATKELNDLLNKLAGTEGKFSSSFAKDMAVLTSSFLSGRLSIVEYGKAHAQLIEQQPFFKAGLDQEAAALKHLNDLRKDAQELELDDINARGDVLDALKDRVQALKEENAAIGMTDQARKLYLIELEREKALKYAADADVAQINRYYDEIAALTQVGDAQRGVLKAQEDSARSWEDLADRVIRGFRDMRAALKTFAQELIAMFAKKYFLQMVAGVTGSSSLAAAAGQVGGNSLAGGLLGSVGGFIGEFSSALAGTFVGPIAEGISAAGIGTEFASVVGAIPVWGQIALGIGTLVAIFSQHRGGPKEEGTFGQTSILSGSNDAQLRVIGEGLGQSFTDFLARVGGKTNLGPNPFSIGLSVDPKGDSPTFLDAILRGPGGDVYRHELRDVGRSPEEIQKALTLESKRMLLAALQASDLPAEVAAILNSVSAVTGTEEDIDRVTKAALEWADAADQAARTASAAAEQMKTDWAQAQDLIDRLSGRDPSQRHLQDAVSEFERANPWAAGLTPAELVAAFKTITEEDFKSYSAENRQLILAILGLADTLDDTAETVTEAATTIAQAIYLPEQGAQTLQQQFESQYGGLIGSAPGLMGQLSLRSQLMSGQVATWMQQQAGLSQYDPAWQTLQNAIESFQQRIAATGADIAQLTILTAQYGEAKGEELFNLQKWYDAQRALVAGNAEALAALDTIFHDKWQDILDGITSQADDAKARLADWWKGLFLNEQLSPLTPKQRFSEAERQYRDTLALAQGGDVEAIGRLSGDAQTYLEIARQIFGSSAAYTAIFRDVATATGGVAGITQADINSRLYSALPTSSPIMSSADASGIRNDIRDLISALLSGNAKVQAPGVEEKIERLANETQTREGAVVT